MAIYRYSLQTISRAKGRSATAAAAYRAGERIQDERTGRTHDYRRKGRGVIASALVGWNGTRAELWNAAEAAERRGNSVVAREAQIALPAELDERDRWTLALAMAEWLHQRYGVAVDVALHDHATNPHAHLMFTTRTVSDGRTFGAKTRVLDQRRTGAQEVERMRATWARLANMVLADRGRTERIDHRSHVRQGADRESEHMSRAAVALESKGQRTEQGDRRHRRRLRNRARAARRAARAARRPAITRSAVELALLNDEHEPTREVQERVSALLDRLDAEDTPQTHENAPQTHEDVREASTPTPKPRKAVRRRSGPF